MTYFYDDGTEFDPELIPKPEMCLRCRSNLIQDWEEEILCNLTRADQREEKEFRCKAFRWADK